MMSKRSKKRFYSGVLCVVMGILVIPMIFVLVGGDGGPSPDEVQKCLDSYLGDGADTWSADWASAHRWFLKFCSE